MSNKLKAFLIGISILFVIWSLLSILRLNVVFYIYTDIANWVSINLNIDDQFSTILAIVLTAVLVPTIPYFIWYFTLGRYKIQVLLITIGIAGTVAFLLHKFGQDVYFDPRTGDPIRYYASTPNGVIFSRGAGYDKKFRIEFKPVIPEIIASLENQKKGIKPKKIELDIDDETEFFDPINGSPKIFYYELPDGNIELFSSAGIHPQYGEALRAITQETITKLKNHLLKTTEKVIGNYLIKNDIAIDKTTKLIWMRCSVGQQWDGQSCVGQAKEYDSNQALQIAGELAKKYKWGGYSDWRVPNIDELRTLVRLENKPVTINPEVFPNTPQKIYMSSDTDFSFFTGSCPLVIDFASGKRYKGDSRDYAAAIRLVHKK
ncbi:MAG: DUF1566 domain-containing protein [Methylococcales bacterium]